MTLEEQKKEADKINNDLMINKQKAEKEITDADKEYNTQSAQAQKRADDMVRSAQQDYEQAEKQFSKQKVDARTEADRRLALIRGEAASASSSSSSSDSGSYSSMSD